MRTIIKKNALRDASRLYDIRSVLGVPQNKSVIICPLPQHSHHDYTPSFSIFTKDGKQRFRCHGSCGAAGDIIDLIGYMKIPGYNDRDFEDVSRALTLLEVRQEISPPVKNTQRASTLQNDTWKKFIPAGPEVLQYLAKRGILRVTVDLFGYGQMTSSPEGVNIQPYTTWLTIPTFTGSRLTKIKMRNIYASGKSDRYKAMKGSVIGIHNLNAVKECGDAVLIVKGELSVALLSQYGVLACAPDAGEGSTEEWMYIALAFSKKRVVVGDNDPEPIMQQTKLLLKKRAVILHAEAKLPPNNYHDVDDWILADGAGAIRTIKGWLEK